MDGLEQDVFDGQGGAVVDIELAAALGLADMDPVGGSVAGALEASRVTEGLQEHGTLPVAVVPVQRQTPGRQGEQMGGQRGETNPGQDEIAGVIDDEGQVALAGGGIPADEAVAGGGLPSRGAEAEQGQQQAVGRMREVAQLGPRQGFVAERIPMAMRSVRPQRYRSASR